MTFNFVQAMNNLGIKPKPFDEGNSDCRGYSRDRWFAINPDERYPELVSFHEWAHILQGHTVKHERMSFFELFIDKEMNGDLYEAECHATAIFAAMLTGVSFDLDAEIKHLRGYTQGRPIPVEVKARALETAMAIAKAGAVEAQVAA